MIEDFVADFKNMKKANYHEAQITLTEAVLVPFFVVDLEHVFVCKDILSSI